MKKAACNIIVVILSLWGSASATQAQGVFDMGVLTNTLSMDVLRQSEEKRAGTMRGKTHRHPALHGNTRYHPSLAARKRNLAQMVSKLRAASPQLGDALQQDATKGDLIAATESGLRRYGLHADDVADSMTVYLVTAWYGVRGRTDDPPQPQVRGVREQMRRALLSTAAFASLSNDAKQQLAEAMLVQTIVTDALVKGAKGKPEQMAGVKAGIAQGVRNSFHFDLTKVQLTESGLRM